MLTSPLKIRLEYKTRNIEKTIVVITNKTLKRINVFLLIMSTSSFNLSSSVMSYRLFPYYILRYNFKIITKEIINTL